LILRHFHIIFIIFRPQLSIRFSIALRWLFHLMIFSPLLIIYAFYATLMSHCRHYADIFADIFSHCFAILLSLRFSTLRFSFFFLRYAE
jgi:hypothetical protein